MEDYGNEEVYDGTENSVEEEGAEESGYSDDSQNNAEESAEGTTEDGAEGNAGDAPADSIEDGEAKPPSSVDVGELVNLLKSYTEDSEKTVEETAEETDAGVDTSVPEVPTAVTDAATVETLAEIRDMLDGMSISMNSIYTETAAYQTESLSYMEKSNSWLVSIIIALLVLGISAAFIVGLKIADIFFGRMRT